MLILIMYNNVWLQGFYKMQAQNAPLSISIPLNHVQYTSVQLFELT